MERSTNLINFVFEDLENCFNLTACTQKNTSGLPRFCPSPLAQKIIMKKLGYATNQNIESNFIVAVGVNNSPEDWATGELFEFLPKKTKQSLVNNRALLLIDQSLEGYHDDCIWSYLHEQCSCHDVKASNIIYVTGNLKADDQYEVWHKQNIYIEKINVVPFANFEDDIYRRAKTLHIDVSVGEHLKYKRKSNVVKDYNCMQKRQRNHRIWLYHELFKRRILNKGICSMNKFSKEPPMLEGHSLQGKSFKSCRKILPVRAYGKSNNKRSDRFYIDRIQKKLYLDTWVTVVSEASFADEDNTLFLSEKLFKPIACRHPFIVFGNRHSLTKLRSMGYKTFEGFIDESYDSLPTLERFSAVMESIEKIIAIKDKAAWFNQMKDILDHNYKTLQINSQSINPAFKRVEDIYGSKFL